MSITRDELALSINEAEWSFLRAHLERGGLILINNTLDLAEVGVKIARDDTAPVEEWIHAGNIGKPSETQIQAWDADTQKKFAMLIVSPYVLIQE